MADGKARSLEPLRGLTGLRSLFLVGTKVESFEPLFGFVSLERVQLQRNPQAELVAELKRHLPQCKIG